MTKQMLERCHKAQQEAAPQALHNRLYAMGVEYDISDSPWIHKQKYRE